MDTEVTEIYFGGDGVFDAEERKNMINEMLHDNICEVTFTKVNGEQRVMPCTLNPLVVPPTPEPKVLAEGEVAKVKKPNPDTMSVWCTDKGEWRSFRIVNVTNVKVLK